MKKTLAIEEKYSDELLNIAFDTLKINKQGIIFVNTKRGAESEAEKISNKLKINTQKLNELSEKILNVLDKPTKQCTKLSLCVKKGIAFHHAGLHSEQRNLIEENFRNGNIKIIAATPTLAAGVDLPAFRTIIRDLKRYGLWGMQFIPVLEYEQQAGRAGRPNFDEYGESICIAQNENEKENIIEKYINGKPEEILSKLAVEPVLRTYVLSLVATEFVNTEKQLLGFFEKTFYAFHYEDIYKIHSIVERILEMMEEWEFIKISKDKLEATLLGKRVSELYIDPYTAFFIMTCLRRATQQKINEFSFLNMVSSCLELRPLLRCKTSEYEDVQEQFLKYSDYLLKDEPSVYEDEYNDFVNEIKTTLFFMEWTDERDEEYLLEKYNIRPGEIRAKLDLADWLLYSAEELARLLKFHSLIKEIAKTRYRLQYGVKEELIPLLQLKNIGRVRARRLFNNGIKNIRDIKSSDITKLAQLLGKSIAVDVKKQVGQEFSEDKIKIKENKRKGQISLKDY